MILDVPIPFFVSLAKCENMTFFVRIKNCLKTVKRKIP